MIIIIITITITIRPKLVLGVYRFRSVIFVFFWSKLVGVENAHPRRHKFNFKILFLRQHVRRPYHVSNKKTATDVLYYYLSTFIFMNSCGSTNTNFSSSLITPYNNSRYHHIPCHLLTQPLFVFQNKDRNNHPRQRCYRNPYATSFGCV